MKKRSIAWLVLMALVAVGVLTYAATRTIYVGHMLLPRSQVVAVAICLLIAGGMFFLWTGMLVRAGLRIFGSQRQPAWFERPLGRATGLGLLLSTVPLLLYGRYVEPRWLKTKTVSLGQQSPGAIRVAVLSDLHVESARPPFTDIAQAVNASKPDVVVLLGDLLNRDGAVPLLQKILGEIKAEHGKFAVYGNWETWYWHRLPLLKGTGFEWLRRQTKVLNIRGQRLYLVGYPYSDEDPGQAAERQLSKLPRPGWRLFLYHTPDLVEQVPSADLYLAGHTHGGQISIPLFGALVTLSRFGKEYERGLYQLGDRYLYTNPGIGVEPKIQFRIGVRPEVTLFKLGPR